MQEQMLVISEEISGETVRYILYVTKEVIARYYKIRKEQPELTEMEAYDLAAEE